MTTRRARFGRWAHPKIWQVVLVAMLVMTGAVSYAVYAARVQSGQNKDRIADIQESRLESCRQTYEGIRQVFRPFFRPPAQRTAKERSDIAKFNRTVDALKAKCGAQTRS